MSKALIVATFFFALLGVGVRGNVPTEPTYTLAVCETAFGNFTTSDYSNNRLALLANLALRANSSFVFDSGSFGAAPDTVFGQFYCRGDIPSTLCAQCVQQAAVATLIKCPDSNAAITFYQECNVHYRNEPLLGVEVEIPRVELFTVSNVTDPETFFTVANTTVSGLVMEVVSGESKFATGEGVVSDTVTMYSLVQCSPDMNDTQCASCLDIAAQVAVSCCGHWPSAMYVFLPSCQMMYNTLARFYYTPGGATAPSPSSFTPSSSLDFIHLVD